MRAVRPMTPKCPIILPTLLLTLLITQCSSQVLKSTCLSSDLPKGVRLSQPCGHHFRDICRAWCIIHDAVVWKKLTMCLLHGKWSPLPTCQTTRTLELIRCNRVSDMSQEDMAACVKIKITVPGRATMPKAICPDVLQMFVKFGSCHKKPETDCAITCRNGYFILLCMVNNRLAGDCKSPPPSLCPELKYAKLVNCSRLQGVSCKLRCPNGRIADVETFCLPTYEWSPLPACTSRSQCKKQKLPAKLHFLSSTCKKSKSPNCRVGCKVRVFSPKSLRTSHEVVFVKDIYCTPSGEWRGLPDCEKAEKLFWDERVKKWLCAKPKLGKFATIKRPCSHLEGSVCRYKCKKGFSSKGHYTIRCLGKKWHGIHKCEPVLCPKLPEIYELKNNCQPIALSVCEAGCRGGELMGNSTILCRTSGHWSPLPLCVPSHTCPRQVSPQILIASKCSFKEGDKCQVRCVGRLVLIGSLFVNCRKGKWRDVPDCFPESETPYKIIDLKCHFPPQLNGNLQIIGFCKPVGGMSCDIGCRDESAVMTGPNATTCLPPGLWSFVKPCIGGKSYCSTPKFHHLQMMEYCSGKEIGSSCQMRCKHRPNMKFSIICTNEVKWSTPPNCTCPSPSLREGVELKENCRTKQMGQKCSLRCKNGFLMIGVGIITCNTVLQWTPLPLCKKIICPKPRLTSALMFKEDCSAIQSGKSCSLECKERGKMFHHSKINCINGKHWSKLPTCACPQPALDGGMETKNECKETLPGQKCFISCKRNLFLVGKNFIVCQSNTKWSRASLCKRIYCPKPSLPDTLIFNENCNSKEPGESCRMACKNLGSLVGPRSIICLNSTRWTPMPSCSCPPPSLPDFFEAKENCRRKLPGESCPLACTDDMKLVGNPTIQCQSDSNWGPLPSCKENYCIKTQLPRNLMHSSNCATLQPGQKCFVQCKEGGEVDGDNFITCIEGSQWTDPPKCRCPSPILSYYLATKRDCSRKRIGEKCDLWCQERHQLVGRKFITCQNNTLWSRLPKCVQNFCSKIKLPSYLIYAEECSLKSPGEKCKLKCFEGGEFIGNSSITCINGTKWSTLPKCACPPPNLRERLISTENCSKKLIGQKCNLKCKKNFKFSGENFIKCQNDTRWSPLPDCVTNFCTRPILPIGLRNTEDCTSKVPGESCLLECEGGGKLVGSNKITCLNATKWDSFPKCACRAPFLDKNLSTKEDCRKKLIGEKCRLSCGESFELLVSDTITCQSNSHWSSSPRCKKLVCPKPILNKILRFSEDCTSKSPKETCELECSERGQVIGSKFISCLKKGNTLYWSALPLCTCADPTLPSELKLLGNCRGKRPGQTCKVNCTGKFTTLGGSFIRCKNDTKWTNHPKCVFNTCMSPKLPATLQLQEDCSSKIVGESCRLKCRNGGNPVNTSQIFCSKSRSWPPLPKCTCPPINLQNGVKLMENCSAKLPGETCKAACISLSFRMNRSETLICKNDSKWNFQPTCIKMLCSQPNLPAYLVFKGRCSDTSIGSVCSVQCAEKGRLIGDSFIKCLAGSFWSKSPDCTCPKPILPNQLRTVSNCDFKKRGESCAVKCENGLKISGSDFILCQNNTKWSLFPKCVQTLCPPPDLSSSILFKLKEDCSKKTVADKCEITCKNGRNIIGNKYLVCLNDFKWKAGLPEPDCACKTPNLTDGLQFVTSCSFTKKTERCNLTCKQGYNLIGLPYITCQTDLTWTSPPSCKIIQCPVPVSVLGDPALQIRGKESCGFKKSGEKCFLQCKNDKLKLQGKDYIVCQNNTKWSSSPTCISSYCPKPNLFGGILMENEDCSTKRTGEECRVSCKNGGMVIGHDRLRCSPNNTWSSLPECTCPAPQLKDNSELKSSCSLKKRNEKCAVVCTKGSKTQQNTTLEYITCQSNGNWSATPACMKRSCKIPSPTVLGFNSSCFDDVSAPCNVYCLENGTLIGKKQVRCLENQTWSKLPDCACPPPVLPEYLKTLSVCDFVKRGDLCLLNCQVGSDIFRNDNTFITCQNNTRWSSLPKCEFFCKAPDFSLSSVESASNCDTVLVGDRCLLRCKHGGKIMADRDYITCVDKNTWDNMPDCSCPNLNVLLIQNLYFNEDCSEKRIYHSCMASCSRSDVKYHPMHCSRDASWTNFPTCYTHFCPVPILDLEKVAINEPNSGDCSRKQMWEVCHLSCKNGGTLQIKGVKYPGITCMTNYEWSIVPDCSCAAPTLNEEIDAAEDCSLKELGEYCVIQCKGGLAISKYYILCLETGEWDKLPSCSKPYCFIPDLDSFNPLYAIVEGNCEEKRAGETCQIRCTNNGRFSETDRITCLSDLTWSATPECSCPSPTLSHGVLLQEDCSSKFPHQYCLVSCQSGMTPNRPYILCKEGSEWDAVPVCEPKVCPPPALPEAVMELSGECIKKKPGETCYISCKARGTADGNSLMCQADYTWSEYISCNCPLPDVKDELEVTEDCSFKRPGDQCGLKCKNGYDLPKNYITCLENTQWEAVPPCVTKVCPPPALPEGILEVFNDDCSVKQAQAVCRLRCVNGGNILSSETIMCTVDFIWTPLPSCTCPTPPTDEYLELVDDCRNKGPNEFCTLRCKNGYILEKSYITCLQNSQWEPLPACVSKVCLPPALPEGILQVSNDDCSAKQAGTYCQLRCAQGGNIMGSETIMCTVDFIWTPLPSCTCPTPPPDEYLELVDDCRNKGPNEFCTLKCKNGYILEKSYITCLQNSQWEPLPACVSKVCPPPVLPEGMLQVYNDDCSAKPLGGYCLLRCVHGGNIAHQHIQCEVNFIWSSLPSCTCPSLVLSDQLEMLEDCRKKGPNDVCLVRCRNNFPLAVPYVQCLPTARWASLPVCAERKNVNVDTVQLYYG